MTTKRKKSIATSFSKRIQLLTSEKRFPHLSISEKFLLSKSFAHHQQSDIVVSKVALKQAYLYCSK